MIGKISIGKSFGGCLAYCLEDKKQSVEQELVIKNRAELLTFNQCFGNKKELIRQFNEVRQLNPKLSKPVLHIALSLPPDEKVSKAVLMYMVNDCAKSLGFESNQYVAIHHIDTDHQHLHIVANRVGFNGSTIKDNHNYQRIAAYCRQMEVKHGLKQVLSPRRYLPKELRLVPRLDTRKETLRQSIQDCISTAINYPDFERKIRNRGYEVIKARGISFVDKQKVKVKGSEVGYSLQTIENLLGLKPELRLIVLREKELKEKQQLSEYLNIHKQKPTFKANGQLEKPIKLNQELRPLKYGSVINNTLEVFLNHPMENTAIDHHLTQRKKRKRKSQHL